MHAHKFKPEFIGLHKIMIVNVESSNIVGTNQQMNIMRVNKGLHVQKDSSSNIQIQYKRLCQIYLLHLTISKTGWLRTGLK